jgi:hypothetical protein
VDSLVQRRARIKPWAIGAHANIGRNKVDGWLDFGGTLHEDRRGCLESFSAEPHHGLGQVSPLASGTSSLLAPGADGGVPRRNLGP